VELQLFFQLLLNGLSIGLLYSLICVGFVVILSVPKVFNFAHGQFYMLGAYALYAFHVMLGLNFALSLVLAALSVGLIGAICGRYVFMRVRPVAGQRLGESLLKAAAVTIGMGLIFQQMILHSFGPAERGVKPIFPGVLDIGGVTVNLEKLAVTGYALCFIAILWWFLTKSRTGIAMRAAGMDQEAAILQGINTRGTFVVAVAAGTALAGAAGAIIAPVLALGPEMGGPMLHVAFMALLLGGMQSILGAGVGGLMLGIGLSFGFHFLGELGELAFFLLIALVLVFKPTGLMGGRLEV